MKVTLRDIAAKTGFSVNTVSHALTGKTDISKATRTYICRVANEMGYIRNSAASSLRSGRSRTVAVILPDMTNPHFSILLRGIEAFFRSKGYMVFVLNTDENARIEAEAIHAVLGQSVAGIILCPAAGDEENLRYLRSTEIPFTLIGRYSDTVETDYVVCDDAAGAYLAVRHLIKEGHRKISYFDGDARISTARERLAGCRRALAESGLTLPPERHLSLSPRAGGNHVAMREFFEANTDATAVLAFSDLLAFEAIRTLEEMGRAVPHDVSIIGFDNICADFPLPLQLSSVSISKKTMASTAAELLWRKLEGKADEINHIILPTKLVNRSTVRAKK